MRRRGRVAAALLSAGVAATVLGACRAREDSFTERVAAAARRRLPEATVTVKERFHLEITGQDGTSSQMYLDNLWRTCQTQKDACDDAIARMLAAAAQGQGSNDAYVRADTLRAILKDRQWIDNVRQMIASGPPEKAAQNALVSRPFVADLFIVYVFDLPDGMRMVTQGDLAKLKLDEARVHALALSNLEEAAREMAAAPLRAGSGIRVLHVGDSYEASRLILHERWRAMAGEVKGDLVVAVPSRDYVYYTGSKEDVDELRVLARRAADENNHAITETLLRWTPGGWEAFRP